MKATDKVIVDTIAEFISREGYSPSMRDVADEVGISIGAIKHRLDRMRKDGLVDFVDGKARTLRVVQHEG